MKIEAIDLFCGIGGLTYGLRQAGIEVLAGLDNDPSCEYAFEKNNGAKFICADIENFDFTELKALYSRDCIKVLVGCAPCQPFSSHTQKIKNRSEDTRWGLLRYFLKAVEIIEPDIVSMENVPGLVKTEIFKEFVQKLHALEYQVDSEIVFCPEYGVPQNRRRLVLLASRKDLIRIPSGSHNKETFVTVKDILLSLPPIEAGGVSETDDFHRSNRLTSKNLDRIRQSKPGGSWKDWDPILVPECFKKKTGKSYTPVYGRMSWDSISPTITTQFYNYGSGRFGHPEQDRALSLREGALLQTFPAHYDFGEVKSLDQAGRHIGNAVPPRLGTAIGSAIKAHAFSVYA